MVYPFPVFSCLLLSESFFPFWSSICHHTKAGLSLYQQIKLHLILLSLAYLTICLFPLPLPTLVLLPHSLHLCWVCFPHSSAPYFPLRSILPLRHSSSRSRAPSFWFTYRLTHTSLHFPSPSHGCGSLSPTFLLTPETKVPSLEWDCCAMSAYHSPFASHMVWVPCQLMKGYILSLWYDMLLSLILSDTRTQTLSWGSGNRISGNAFSSSVKKITHQIIVWVIQTPSNYKPELGI